MPTTEAPPSLPVIDAHQHIGAEDGDLEGRVAILNERGVDQAIVIAQHTYLRPDGIADTRVINDGVAEYRGRKPDRFVAAVGVVEPVYGARGLDEIDRCADELHLAGISFHARFQGVSNDGVWVRRYIERMGEHGMVVFMHAMGESIDESLWKVEAVARDLPDMAFVVLDAFITVDQSALVPHVAERCPKLLFDTAAAHGWSFLAPLVDRCGASRLAYGSNLHATSPGSSHLPDPLPLLDEAHLSDDDRQAILGGNIARVLGLDG